MSKTKLLDDFELIVMHGDPLTAAPRSAWEFEGDNAIVPQQPTGSAYSVEEHMFKQDEIQKRHPQSTAAAVASSRSWNPPQPADQQRSELPGIPTHESRKVVPDPPDQQRSEAVVKEMYGWSTMADKEVADAVRMLGRSDIAHEVVCCAGRDRIMKLSAAIAERDATIAALRAEVERLKTPAGAAEVIDSAALEPESYEDHLSRTIWDT